MRRPRARGAGCVAARFARLDATGSARCRRRPGRAAGAAVALGGRRDRRGRRRRDSGAPTRRRGRGAGTRARRRRPPRRPTAGAATAEAAGAAGCRGVVVDGLQRPVDADRRRRDAPAAPPRRGPSAGCRRSTRLASAPGAVQAAARRAATAGASSRCPAPGASAPSGAGSPGRCLPDGRRAPRRRRRVAGSGGSAGARLQLGREHRRSACRARSSSRCPRVAGNGSWLQRAVAAQRRRGRRGRQVGVEQGAELRLVLRPVLRPHRQRGVDRAQEAVAVAARGARPRAARSRSSISRSTEDVGVLPVIA